MVVEPTRRAGSALPSCCDTAPPGARPTAIPPWQTTAATILLGLITGLLGATGLAMLATTTLGGGVESSDGSGTVSVTKSLAAVAVTLAGAGLVGLLTLGVHRGRLLASLVATVGATALVALGIGDVVVAHTASLNEVQMAVTPAFAVWLLLLSPAHRRWVTARRAA